MSDQWHSNPTPETTTPDASPPEAPSAPVTAPPIIAPQEPASGGWGAATGTESSTPTKQPIEQMPTAGARIGRFFDDLASDAPTPGGGAWAALSAAAGAALIAMVARLTLKKKGFEEVADRMRQLADECDDERHVLLGLADRDAEAYREVMGAYKLPKTTPEEQNTWSATLQKALERAADIPLEVARRSVYLMALAEETLTSGNPNAASDALSAAASLHAAALAALANVDINAITFIDKTRQQELADSANSLRHRAQSILRDVSEAFFIAVHS
ncbi:MAG: cyclodeaminase/cyclohydrolase family protein [Actinomycetota bacterium]|nr:cyclodeaminase/cyclohydrolase family protein [Actinomycetota bacterium]